MHSMHLGAEMKTEENLVQNEKNGMYNNALLCVVTADFLSKKD